jgi:hypothetical protein
VRFCYHSIYGKTALENKHNDLVFNEFGHFDERTNHYFDGWHYPIFIAYFSPTSVARFSHAPMVWATACACAVVRVGAFGVAKR